MFIVIVMLLCLCIEHFTWLQQMCAYQRKTSIAVSNRHLDELQDRVHFYL